MAATHESDGSRRTELDWLAFQYVAGELSSADERQLEGRLIEDPELAAAVSRAVALASAVTRACVPSVGVRESVRPLPSLDSQPARLSRPAPPLPTVRSRALTSLIVTAGVFLAAVLFVLVSDNGLMKESWQTAQTEPASVADGGSVDADRAAAVESVLVESWTAARDSLTALDELSPADAVVPDLPEGREEATGDVPEWLFVAVELTCHPESGSAGPEILEN